MKGLTVLTAVAAADAISLRSHDDDTMLLCSSSLSGLTVLRNAVCSVSPPRNGAAMEDALPNTQAAVRQRRSRDTTE
eukprot:CAMPEP_0183504364 /NCGR_PEP_ID=MMETSP0371-20130417/5781_1 /TAXON_ID=268820 /ORGANISM="Peridinium aciculiferum, Strain PAER-2" /LENGTH=76 /DNA_ID=CAMNT_0025699693 /DNA_START=16 /DNA_END=244 /DNA_ORIENTATION=+